jgi:Ca-activated chloride channel family protein
MTTTTHSLGRRALLAITLALAALFAGSARADEALVQPGDSGTGALLLRTTEAGRFVEAPRLRTDVAVTVTGTVARARVTQVFENPSDQWVEGLYVFPLPADAGVDTLRMQVGNRFLEGQVKERKEARQIYERAAAQGTKATLIEQQRPNLFTNSVANIDPHGTVVVQIEYQHVVRLDGDQLSLRVPLVVAPRSSRGVFDPAAIATRVADPKAGKINPVTLSVTLRAGVPLAGIASAYHTVQIERPDPASATVTVVGDTPADRDFVLNWRLAPSAAPQAAVFREDVGGETYYLALVMPSVGAAALQPLPREAIFVIDNSGSMAGESMRQAKSALLFALRALGPADRFNVIRFDDKFETVFPAAVPADRAHLAIAERFVEKLQADGGTEILPPLRAALADPTPNDLTRLRQVVLLTDGAVGNEAELLGEVGQSLGRSRLFTIGIGSAPNSYLMEHMARLGRGTFTHVGSEQEVGLRVSALFAKLDSPVLTDLVATNDAQLEIWPNPVPDLYAGEPIVLTAVSPGRAGTAGTLQLYGRVGGAPWSAALDLAQAVRGPGVEKLWARAKLGAVEEWRYRGAAQADVDAEVLKVALQHHLVSRLTSLVAVDMTPSRPESDSLFSAPVATNLPHGWDFDKFLEGQAKGAATASSGPLAKLLVSAAPAADPENPGIALPQTDAGTDRQILLGALLLAAGAALARARRAPPRPC